MKVPDHVNLLPCKSVISKQATRQSHGLVRKGTSRSFMMDTSGVFPASSEKVKEVKDEERELIRLMEEMFSTKK